MNTEVIVLYFAKSAELTGVKSEKIRVNSELTALQLWQQLEHKHPKLSSLRQQVILAVRREYVSVGEQVVRLQPGDEVAVIPPLSGEAVMEDKQGLDLIKLTTEKLSTDAVSESVTCSSCGALSLFIGTTRDHFEGKKVVQLEYEAYVPMAESELRKICADVRRRWPAVRHICIHHRLGVVPVREASVIIGISSPHRSDSLEAVKFGIDALKSSVPIWKKELYESEESCWKENSECVWTGRLDQRKNS